MVCYFFLWLSSFDKKITRSPICLQHQAWGSVESILTSSAACCPNSQQRKTKRLPHPLHGQPSWFCSSGLILRGRPWEGKGKAWAEGELLPVCLYCCFWDHELFKGQVGSPRRLPLQDLPWAFYRKERAVETALKAVAWHSTMLPLIEACSKY